MYTATFIVMLILFSLAIVLARIAGIPMDLHHVDFYATLLEFGGLGLYAFFASRRFYNDGLLAGLVKGVILTFSGYGLFLLYRSLLLFTVVYSI